MLDTQCKVQQDTTEALTKIIELQDTRAIDMYVSDLPKFSGEPQAFLDWIVKIEKVFNLLDDTTENFTLQNLKEQYISV